MDFKNLSVLRYILILSVFSLFSGTVEANINDSIPASINIVRVDKGPELTGKLDDPLWMKAPSVELIYEIYPGDNISTGHKTEVRALYDNKCLYLAFRCYDTCASDIRAHLCNRDQIFSDDYVIASIDTDNNYQRGYEFAVNPYGIQGDLLFTAPGNEDTSYDLIWYSEASIDADGWIAEMCIPFRQLDFPETDIQSWTIVLIRNIPRENRVKTSWTKMDRSNPNFVSDGGILEGLENVKPGGSVDILPYVLTYQTGEKSDVYNLESPMSNDKIRGRVGGGIQYSPSSSLNLNIVVNPDFSQIESDADQISINSTFALYYREKRPFFMSGKDMLETPMYYSRTINNPLFAAKAHGKYKNLSYYGLSALDRNTFITVPGEEESNTVTTGLNSLANIGRIRYDMGRENYIGAMVFTRNFSEAANNLAGFDWRFRFLNNWYVSGELFLTNTRELNDTLLFLSGRELGSTGYNAGFDGEIYSGTGMHLGILREGRHYKFSLTQNIFSPTFQSYNGSFHQVNYRESYITNTLRFYPEKKLINRVFIYTNGSLIYNCDGQLKKSKINSGIILAAIGQTNISIESGIIISERFHNVLFKGLNTLGISITAAPLSGLEFGLEYEIGKEIYRSDIPLEGRGYNFIAQFIIKPVPRLSSEFSLSVAELNDTDSGLNFYKGFIARNLTTLHFNRRMYLRLISQYNSFYDSFNIYPLINYRFNVFSSLCLGTTQDYQNYEENSIRFIPSGRQFFLKFQYLFSL